MDISKQVCTIEQGKRLNELGILGKTLFAHVFFSERVYRESKQDIISASAIHEAVDAQDIYPAFTVAELGQMLNSETYTMRTGTELSEYANWEWVDQGNAEDNGGFDTEAEARAAMLIEMLKSKLITADQANERLNA